MEEIEVSFRILLREVTQADFTNHTYYNVDTTKIETITVSPDDAKTINWKNLDAWIQTICGNYLNTKIPIIFLDDIKYSGLEPPKILIFKKSRKKLIGELNNLARINEEPKRELNQDRLIGMGRH
jgi:hypothetical protein